MKKKKKKVIMKEVNEMHNAVITRVSPQKGKITNF